MMHTSSPLVSVVIPVFNGGDFLQQAVASVENQTYDNVQLVLVDGGSSDGSREWIERYARESTCVHEFLPLRTPAAATWTRATELADGTYTVLLCQDDVLYSHALESQVTMLDGFPHAAMVSAKRDIIDKKGGVIKRSRGAQGIAPGVHPGTSLIRIAFSRATNVFGEPLAVLFRTEALRQQLPWDDSHPFMLDLDMYRRVLAESFGVVSHDTIGAFRVSASSWSTRLAKEQERQFAVWLDDAASILDPPPSSREHRRARRHLREQTLIRRGAYAWLDLRHRT